MIRRQAIAVLALVGALDATYLLLHKLGVIGSLACAAGASCNVVNSSSYSSILGIPVAAIGLAGYIAILLIALMAAQPGRVSESRWDLYVALLAGGGAAFSAYLTFVSLYFIGTACPYCLVSFGIITTIMGLSAWGILTGRRSIDAAGALRPD